MTVTAILYAGCAALYLALTALIVVRLRLSRTGWYLAAAGAVSALWAGLVALHVGLPWGGPGGLVDLLRSVVWYGFLLHLYRMTVPGRGALRQAFVVTGLIGLVVIVVGVLSGTALHSTTTLFSVGTGLRLGLAVCNILLVENLYRNAVPAAKWHINLPCIGLGALFAYDVVLWADAALFGQLSMTLVDARAIAAGSVVPLLAVGAARNRDWSIDIHVSREAVFHSATLILAGVFLIGLAAIGQVLRYIGTDWGAAVQISLLFIGFVSIAVLLTSGSARSWLQHLLVTHFFSRRYDYEKEWMRCIAILSGEGSFAPLHTRVIRAVANIVDSPGGALFLAAPDGAGAGGMSWAGSSSMAAAVTDFPASHPLLAAFRAGQSVLVLRDAPELVDRHPVLANAWLAVKLPRSLPAEETLGFVLLKPPRASFTLDAEVFALLTVVARQVAAAVTAQQAAETLMQTRALHDYGKRFAFVAHDIKNVSSQLSMLLANAEHHMSNPEFQRDMLVTVRASVARISGLLRRLQTPDAEIARAVVRPAPQVQALVATQSQGRRLPIELDLDDADVTVAMAPANFDAVVTHLLNNAVEATMEAELAGQPTGPVRLRLRREDRRLTLEVIDTGLGMDAAFIRDSLFRPFTTSKPLGSGIGAFQARELVREAGGELQVASVPGQGTTMRIVVPLLETVAG